jgi:DNA primase
MTIVRKINIEGIKQISIYDVLGYFNIEIKNNQFCAVWRGERTPSVSIKNNLFKDFGGEKAGSVIDLWIAITGDNFSTSCQNLTKNFLTHKRQAGANLNQIVKKQFQHITINSLDSKIDGTLYSDIYKHLLHLCPLEGKGLAYTNKRGFDNSFIKTLHFGYISDERNTYWQVNNSLKKHFELKDLVKSGLFNDAGKFKGFLGCLIIPYLNGKDEIVNLQFRKINPKQDEPKYQWLKGINRTPYLYNPCLETAKKAKESGYKVAIYITEGVFDFLSCLQFWDELPEAREHYITGFALGSAVFKIEQEAIQKLVTTGATFVLCLDNDKTGQKKIQDLNKQLSLLGARNVKCWIPPKEVKDVNEFFIKNNTPKKALNE